MAVLPESHDSLEARDDLRPAQAIYGPLQLRDLPLDPGPTRNAEEVWMSWDDGVGEVAQVGTPLLGAQLRRPLLTIHQAGQQAHRG